ncbi:hypothetical protein DFP93_103139 [Aneurinibacillus soli]|uniref:Uncharacterized protein n=1 Tax=Aneurinibacillus soli TaxID=1500254 RepID=A0A0U4NJS3_9BACL|nr:hypothetical protein [Aneurinibacillus soli]PYE62929.1 hypothetical protein DFP93_103139 [Aneurinibacillus soli]BAU29012.1 hypothetical protein CB4_03190 [Aneurinibacillus soli]
MQRFHQLYEGREFTNKTEMIFTLLHEANEQIIRIDIGELPNGIDERNEAKFRLLHIQSCFGSCIPQEYRDIYNSLWSQMYRLEYQVGYRHPHLKELLENLLAQKI